MISGATRGAGGAALGNHLGNADHNEAVTCGASRGLVSENIHDQVEELSRLGSHARTQQPLYHIHADPPGDRPWSQEERDRYWELVEQEFGLERQAFASAIHIKDEREHEHRTYLRIRPDGTAIRLDHDYARREKLSRIMECERGEALTKGAHNKAVLAALEKDGRHDVAAAMRAAGLHEGPRPRAATTPGERAQQERTGVTKADVAAATAAAWATSDGGPAFLAAMAERGLRVAMGDKGMPVVLDHTGGAHGLARMLAMDARLHGMAAPKTAVIHARMGGTILPSLEASRQQAIPQPAQAPIQAPAPAIAHFADAPTASVPAPATERAAPDGAPVPVHPAHSGAGGGQAPSGAGGGAASHEAPGSGAALEDAGDGPGEPPGPNANPDERVRYLARLAAWEERKAAAWARFIAGFQAATRPTSTRGTANAGHAESHGGRHSHAAAQTAFAWIQAAREGISNEARPVPNTRIGTTSQGGHAGSGAMEGAGPDDTRDASAHGTSPGAAARPGSAVSIGITQPDNGNPDGVDRHPGKPASSGVAAGADGTADRTHIQRAAATRRLTRGLAAQPAAIAALRRAAKELDPAWRASRVAVQRIQADRDRISKTLATHPHPDPLDRDPKARAAAYTDRISHGIRDRRTAVEAAEEQAATAMQARSKLTCVLAMVGIRTHEQHEAERLAQHANTLTDAAGRAVSNDDYAHARATGEAHAYAAQKSTRLWEARPDVAKAMEDARLNAMVANAMEDGDQNVMEAMQQGHPDVARNIIRQREAEQERLAAERERLAGLAREMHGQGATRPPGPGQM